MDCGERIKLARKQCRLSQGQVAAYLGVTQAFVSMIEKGERTLSTTQAEQMAALFGCDNALFYDDTTEISTMEFAYRTEDITQEDLSVLAEIGKIISNLRQMKKILENTHDRSR